MRQITAGHAFDARRSLGDSTLTLDSEIGSEWQTWTDDGGDTGYSIEYGDQTVLVYGSAPAEDLQAFIGLLSR